MSSKLVKKQLATLTTSTAAPTVSAYKPKHDKRKLKQQQQKKEAEAQAKITKSQVTDQWDFVVAGWGKPGRECLDGWSSRSLKTMLPQKQPSESTCTALVDEPNFRL